MGIRFVYFSFVLAYVYCELLDLQCNRIKKLVDGHNSRRLQLAQGSVPGQPPATKMNAIIWDAELAAKASKWASNNKFKHNPDRTIPSQRFSINENIYWFGTTDPDFDSSDLEEDVMTSWFDEHSHFFYKKMEPSDFAMDPAIGHYTQMSWSDSTYLGCAISHYKEGNWNQFLAVCYYGPAGNVYGEVPYDNGKASGHLTCGIGDCSRMYGDSC